MNRLIPSEMEAYAEAHSMAESAVCRALREETHRTMEYPQMLVGPLEGAFLKMMAQLVGAKRVLEILHRDARRPDHRGPGGGAAAAGGKAQ